MQKLITLDQKIEGAARGVVQGDALGLPCENMKSAAIVDTFGMIKDYLPVGHHNKITEYVEQKKGYAPIRLDQIGVISDDAILTLAGMKSIIEKGEIDIANLFGWHKKMHDIYGGYGFSETVDNKLKAYDGSSDLRALQVGFPSFGNGVMMKQLPYAVYYYASHLAGKGDIDDMDNTIAYITSVTHNTPTAKTISVLHNKVLMHLFQKQPEELNIQELLYMLQVIAPRYDNLYGCNDIDDTSIPVAPIIDKLMFQWKSIQEGKLYTYEQILDTYLIRYKDEKLNKGMRRGYHVASTFGIVYALFLQNQTFQSLIDGIQIGYDTDSQASILGSMVGALHGPFYEQYYVDNIVHKDEIANTISQFKHAISKISTS